MTWGCRLSVGMWEPWWLAGRPAAPPLAPLSCSRPNPACLPAPGARKLPGDWCGINLDSRFVHKYGPLFEATYGQVR